MLEIQEQIELFISRCKELTSKDTMPGIMVPLVTSQDMAEFLLIAIKGSYTPYDDKEYNKGNYRFEKGPLGKDVSNSTDLLNLPDSKLKYLHKEFQKTIKYIQTHLSEFNPDEIDDDSSGLTAIEIVNLAEKFLRYLINLGFHPSYLNAYFSTNNFPFVVFDKHLELRDVINELLLYFQTTNRPQAYSVYTPELIGKGAEDMDFKSVTWDKLPEYVQKAFFKHLSQELKIEPENIEKKDDKSYQSRYRKWQLECETLALSKYLKAEINSCDPFSAAEEFHEKYNLMKHVVYISRKGTGISSNKSKHYEKNNVGRSPVQLQDFSVIFKIQDDENEKTTLVHYDKPSFPYQKLKNEFPRQRELLKLFCSKCDVFRQLTKSYSNALEAFSNQDIENIFRNLAVATELAFAKDNFDEINAKKLLLTQGAKLLALDWLRDQFQSLTTSLTKLLYPGKSEEKGDFQIHLSIIDDEKWNAFSESVKIPVLLSWRREQLMNIINNPQIELDNLFTRFDVELTILWHARHQFAHKANVFREGYFISLLLNLFRIALDYRFSCYAIWLEWQSKQIIEGGENSPQWDVYKDHFDEGWKDEFGERVMNIETDFDKIKQDAHSMIKHLVLGAGYAGLGVLPKRGKPAKPLTI